MRSVEPNFASPSPTMGSATIHNSDEREEKEKRSRCDAEAGVDAHSIVPLSITNITVPGGVHTELPRCFWNRTGSTLFGVDPSFQASSHSP